VLATAAEHESAAEDALRRLAERGPGSVVVHGDLKADNVVRTRDGRIAFIDWERCGAGHPEDDVASLLSSMCVYGLGRAVRGALDPSDGRSLDERVARELEEVRRFGRGLLELLRRETPDVSTGRLGAAFLVSSLCRLQGTLFVPSSEALRLTVSEFVTRSMQRGPDAVAEWLLGGESPSSGGASW